MALAVASKLMMAAARWLTDALKPSTDHAESRHRQPAAASLEAGRLNRINPVGKVP